MNNSCIIPNCSYFNRRGCLICENGLIAGQIGCSKPSLPICLLCKSDEYLGADNKCYKRDMHCSQYKNGACIYCYEGFYLNKISKC